MSDTSSTSSDSSRSNDSAGDDQAGRVDASNLYQEPSDDSWLSEQVADLSHAAKTLRFLSVDRNFRMAAVINSLGPITEGRLVELMGRALGGGHRMALKRLRELRLVRIERGGSAWPSRELRATEYLKGIMLVSGIHLEAKFVWGQWGSRVS